MDVAKRDVITYIYKVTSYEELFFLLIYQLALWPNRGNSLFSAYKQLNFSCNVTII